MLLFTSPLPRLRCSVAHPTQLSNAQRELLFKVDARLADVCVLLCGALSL